MKNKVFVVGMFRTGTSSIANALAILGYTVMHRPWFILKTKEGKVDNWYDDTENWKNFYDIIKIKAKEYDGFSDAPWLFIYDKLDKWYPDSKFILTIRNPKEVARSEINAWTKAQRRKPYTVIPPAGNFIKRYKFHTIQVEKYFMKKDNLLIMNLRHGDGWKELCSFLGCKKPGRKFPHANRSKYII